MPFCFVMKKDNFKQKLIGLVKPIKGFTRAKTYDVEIKQSNIKKIKYTAKNQKK